MYPYTHGYCTTTIQICQWLQIFKTECCNDITFTFLPWCALYSNVQTHDVKYINHKSVFVSIVLWTCICIAASQLSGLAMIGSHFTFQTLAKPAQTSAEQNRPTPHYILICLMSGFVNKQKVIKSITLLRARCLVNHQRLAELLSPRILVLSPLKATDAAQQPFLVKCTCQPLQWTPSDVVCYWQTGE